MKNELKMLGFKKCYAHRIPSGFIMRSLPFGSGHPLITRRERLALRAS